jgi:hypothetical protein
LLLGWIIGGGIIGIDGDVVKTALFGIGVVGLTPEIGLIALTVLGNLCGIDGTIVGEIIEGITGGTIGGVMLVTFVVIVDVLPGIGGIG